MPARYALKRNPAYDALVKADAPAAWWKLNDASGNFADSSGNGHPLTVSGGITYAQPGPLASAIKETSCLFDGTSGTATTTSGLGSPTTLTMECWAYPTSYPAALGQMFGESNYIGLLPGGTVRLSIWVNGAQKTVASTVTLPLNTWAHVVGTWDGSTMRLFLNGRLAASQAEAGTLSWHLSSLYAASHAGADFFAGNLAQIAVYFSALTAERILAHYLAACVGPTTYDALVAQSSPLAWWKLADAVGASVMADSSGHSVNLTVHGTVTNGQPGPLVGSPKETGCLLDGSTGYGRNSASGLAAPTALTYEAWVYSPTAWPSGIRIVMLNGGTTWFALSGNEVEMSLYLSSVGYSVNSGGTKVPVGAWTHIAGTWDGTNLLVYINGVQAGSNTGSGTLTQGLGNCSLGSDIGASDFLAGTLGQVAIYGTCLSAATIAAHYAAGVA